MTAHKNTNFVIVSAILEKQDNGATSILIQTRWKPNVSPMYSGLIEIPAGGVESYENIFHALAREVKEETGLEIVNMINTYQGPIESNRPPDKHHVFVPFLCQQSLETNDGLPWVGFVFRCAVKGAVSMQKEEVKDPRWVSIHELKNLLVNSPEKIFPLQYPVLKYYVAIVEKENAQ